MKTRGRDALLDVVVVGYGLAGRVHACTYQRRADACRLAGIVELCAQRRAAANRDMSGVAVFSSLKQALTVVGGDVLLDLCAPAPQYIPLIKTAIDMGVRRFMLEKPLGWSFATASSLAEMLHDREAVYQDTYLHSSGIEVLLDWVARERSAIEVVNIKFHKNRMPESYDKRGFDNETPPDAWHIEGPHMVTIATKIAGEVSAIEDANLFDMSYRDSIFRKHGGALAILKHEGGVRSRLSMDLCSDENERLVEVCLENGALIRLQLPESKSTHFMSRLEKVEGDRVVDRLMVEDRPMEQCVSNGVDYFLSGMNQAYHVSHGVRVNALLQMLADASDPVVSPLALA